jgi:transcriptional regulator with XRE-family HTH domain
MTQLQLALETGVSARHLSFVETGRSKPGRDMLLRIGERLEIPIRDRNRLLLAAGHAPAFPELPLGARACVVPHGLEAHSGKSRAVSGDCVRPQLESGRG